MIAWPVLPTNPITWPAPTAKASALRQLLAGQGGHLATRDQLIDGEGRAARVKPQARPRLLCTAEPVAQGGQGRSRLALFAELAVLLDVGAEAPGADLRDTEIAQGGAITLRQVRGVLKDRRRQLVGIAEGVTAQAP